jgi:hypothetical protein
MSDMNKPYTNKKRQNAARRIREKIRELYAMRGEDELTKRICEDIEAELLPFVMEE